MASTSVSNVESPENLVHSSDQQHRKLFIGGLSYATTDEKLKEYFSTYGEITESIIMKDREGRSRGFAFVSFQDRSDLDKFMGERPHTIDGRQIEAKRAMPRDEVSKADGQLTVKKIFVNGIDEEFTSDLLKSYFEKFGNVLECNIMKDKEDKLRGFAFVTFDDYDSVDRCILEKPHRINEKEIEIRKAIPREQTIRLASNVSRQSSNKNFNETTPMIFPAAPLFSPFAYFPSTNFYSKPMPLMTSQNSSTPAAILPPSTFYFPPELIQNNLYSHQNFSTNNETQQQTNSNLTRKYFFNEQNSLTNDFSNLNLPNSVRTKSRSNSTTNPEQHRKLFIGGLSFKTTDETLKEYATNFGEVNDCLVMKDQNGQSRCFGFVTFADPKTVDEFMKNRPHNLDGRQIDPKRAMPREEANNDEFHLTVKKIFIGGIRQGLNEQILRDYFSQYGNVNECLLMNDKDGRTRGFAFVEFDDFDSVDKVILARPHTIGDYRVDVKKAIPKEQRQIQLSHQHQQQQIALQVQAAAAACQFYYNNAGYSSLNPGSCAPLINSQVQSIRSSGTVDPVNDHVCPQFSGSNNSNQNYHLTHGPQPVSTSNNRRQSSRGSQ